jgi:phage shock protein A
MWKVVVAAILGRAARVETAAEPHDAAYILERKIEEVAGQFAAAKRGLAALLERADSEAKSLDYLDLRIADLEPRLRAALEAGDGTRAAEAAGRLAELESLRAIRFEMRRSLEQTAERLRLAIERAQRRLADLRQGLSAARAIEAERKGRKAGASAADAPFNDAVRRLLADEDGESLETIAEMQADPSGASVIERLSRAAFETAQEIRAEDVLARLGREGAANRRNHDSPSPS